MRRPWIVATAAIAALVGAWAWSGETPAVTAPPASEGDCVEVGMWSNGYHTSLSMRADLLPASHPLRQLYPQARWLMIGWGDLKFYRSRGDDLWLGVQALMPGGESGMHVLAGPTPVETWYYGKDVLPVGLSRAGVAGLVDYVTDSLALDPNGRAQVVAFEQDGYFLQARRDFNALNVCNHWTMRAFRAAGVKGSAAFAFTGDMAVSLMRERSPRGCSGFKTSQSQIPRVTP